MTTIREITMADINSWNTEFFESLDGETREQYEQRVSEIKQARWKVVFEDMVRKSPHVPQSFRIGFDGREYLVHASRMCRTVAVITQQYPIQYRGAVILEFARRIIDRGSQRSRNWEYNFLKHEIIAFLGTNSITIAVMIRQVDFGNIPNQDVAEAEVERRRILHMVRKIGGGGFVKDLLREGIEPNPGPKGKIRGGLISRPEIRHLNKHQKLELPEFNFNQAFEAAQKGEIVEQIQAIHKAEVKVELLNQLVKRYYALTIQEEDYQDLDLALKRMERQFSDQRYDTCRTVKGIEKEQSSQLVQHYVNVGWTLNADAFIRKQEKIQIPEKDKKSRIRHLLIIIYLKSGTDKNIKKHFKNYSMEKTAQVQAQAWIPERVTLFQNKIKNFIWGAGAVAKVKTMYDSLRDMLHGLYRRMIDSIDHYFEKGAVKVVAAVAFIIIVMGIYVKQAKSIQTIVINIVGERSDVIQEDTVVEAQSATDVFSSIITTIGSFFSSMLGVFESFDAAAFLTKFGKISGSLTSIMTCLTKIWDWIRPMVDWIYESIFGEPFFDTTVISREIIALVKELQTFDGTVKSGKHMTESEAARIKVIHKTLQDYRLKGLDKLKNPTLSQTVASAILSCAVTVSKAETYHKTNEIRQQPLWIHIVGQPNQGKTVLKSLTLPLLYDLIEGQKFANSMVFDRKAGNQFWEGYSGQWGCVIDDYMQASAPEVRMQEAIEMIFATNTNPYQLHMAAMEDKANTFFSSKVIITTSNYKNASNYLPVNTQIESYGALYRRMVVKVLLEKKSTFVEDQTRDVVEDAIARWDFYNLDDNGQKTVKMDFKHFIKLCTTQYKNLEMEHQKLLRSKSTIVADWKKNLAVPPAPIVLLPPAPPPAPPAPPGNANTGRKPKGKQRTTGYQRKKPQTLVQSQMDMPSDDENDKDNKVIIVTDNDDSHGSTSSGESDTEVDEGLEVDDEDLAKQLHQQEVDNRNIELAKENSWSRFKQFFFWQNKAKELTDMKDDFVTQPEDQTVLQQIIEYNDKNIPPKVGEYVLPTRAPPRSDFGVIYSMVRNGLPLGYNYYVTNWNKIMLTIIDMTKMHNEGQVKVTMETVSKHTGISVRNMQIVISEILTNEVEQQRLMEKNFSSMGIMNSMVRSWDIRAVEQRTIWGGRKYQFYFGPPNLDFYHMDWSKDATRDLFDQYLFGCQIPVQGVNYPNVNWMWSNGYQTTEFPTNMTASEEAVSPFMKIQAMTTKQTLAHAAVCLIFGIVVPVAIISLVIQALFRVIGSFFPGIDETVSQSWDENTHRRNERQLKKRPQVRPRMPDKVKVVQAQATLDKGVDGTVRAVSENIEYVGIKTTSGRIFDQFMVFVDTYTAVTAAHGFKNLPVESIVFRWARQDNNACIEIPSKYITLKYMDDRDLVIVTIKDSVIPAHRRIVSHIPPRSEFSGDSYEVPIRIDYKSSGEMCLKQGLMASRFGKDGDNYKELVSNFNNVDIRIANAWVMKAIGGIAGDCGLPYVISNTQCQQKLRWIHVAGTGAQTSYACPIYREDFTTKTTEDEKTESQCTGLFEMDVLEKSFPAHRGITLKPETTAVYEGLRSVATIEQNGKPKTYFMPSKTALINTGIGEEVGSPFKSTKKPAKLAPGFNGVGEFVLPLMNAASRLKGRDSPPPPPDVGSEAFDGIFHENFKFEQLRELSLGEAINGVEADGFLGPMDWTSSGSVGFSEFGDTMDDMFPKVQKNGIIRDARLDLKQIVDMYERLSDADEPVPCICIGTLKDELKAEGKEWKPRLFANGSKAHYLYAKMKLGKLFSQVANHTGEGDVYIGINVHSTMWIALHVKLATKTIINIIADDIEAWDFNMRIAFCHRFAKELRERMLKALGKWANYDPKDPETIRIERYCRHVRNAALSTLSPYIIIGNKIYRYVGMPSGSYATSMWNSMYNSWMQRTLWKIKFPNTPFDSQVAQAAFGDDLLQAFINLARENGWNGVELAKMRKQYFNVNTTSILKAGGEVPEAMELNTTKRGNKMEEIWDDTKAQFLKRQFFLDAQHVYPILNPESINSMVCWIHKNNEIPREILIKQNLEMAMREIAYYGKETYDLYEPYVSQKLAQMNVQWRLPFTHESLMDAYLGR